MFLTTFILGVLPGYKKIGVFAPILLTILRCLQGLSVGGQLVGSALFLVESSQKNKKGFYSALIICTANVGNQLGSIFVGVLSSVMTKHSLNTYKKN